MEFQFYLSVGDTSGDGHEKTTKFLVSSPVSCIKEVEEAYKKGVKIVGLDITKECEEYEYNKLTPKACKKLSKFLQENPDVRPEGITPEDFVKIWIWIANQSNSLAGLLLDDLPTISVGGYGLFS